MVDFAHAFWQILLDLAPWLLLGTIVAGMMHVLLPGDFLQRQLSGKLGIFKAVTLGVPLPLCSCAVIPMGLSLKQGGASSGATVAFLISTPQTGIDSVLVSASLLGWPFALFKVVSATITGLVGGWWTNRQQQISLPILSANHTPATAKPNRLRIFFDFSLEMLRSIWRWLLLGVVVSAALTTWVPTGSLATIAGGNDLAAMVATLVVALPLYVCATASVPIAAALVASGLPAGAALVLLMAGPATNVATIGAVYRTLGKRALAIYLTTVVVGSIGCGWLFGFVLSSTATATAHHHTSYNWWSVTSAILLIALLCWFAWEDLGRQGQQKHSHS